MFLHPTFANVLQVLEAEAVFLHMACFGSATLKPTVFWGTVPWLQSLARTMSRGQQRHLSMGAAGLEVVRAYTSSLGRRRVSGGRDLQGTQAYPIGLGFAVALALPLPSLCVLIGCFCRLPAG